MPIDLRRLEEAHPRIRGEDDTTATITRCGVGSPPHSRGRPRRWRRERDAYRLTPAFAGKTIRVEVDFSTYRAHPRIRGEDRYLAAAMQSCLGSPPHSRGRRRPAVDEEGQEGLTPAFAGKTSPTGAPAYGARAHPCIRGED